jgi:hypothetical protein
MLSGMAMIELNQLTRRFGNLVAVDRLSLDKMTTPTMLTTLLRPSQSSARVCPRWMASHSP